MSRVIVEAGRRSGSGGRVASKQAGAQGKGGLQTS